MVTETDLLLEITTMVSDERFVMNELLTRWDPSTSIGQIEIKTTHMPKSNRAKMTNGVKMIIELGVINRVKRSNYMINPKLLQPRDTELAKETWEQL